jgi:hypothetical protein
MSGGYWRAVLPGPWPGLIEDLAIDGAGSVMSSTHAEALAWVEVYGHPTMRYWCKP